MQADTQADTGTRHIGSSTCDPSGTRAFQSWLWARQQPFLVDLLCTVRTRIPVVPFPTRRPWHAVIGTAGFTLLTFPSFLLGLVESFAVGWYVALIFGPLYNFFAIRFSRARA